MARRRPTEPAANPARGVVLVVIAVLVGLVLLRNGIDADSSAGSSTGGGKGTTADGGTTGGGSSTSSTLGLRSPDEVPLIVLNGSGQQSVAKNYATFLLNKGYTNQTDADGANAAAAADTTKVYYQTGFDKEAAAIASAIKAPATGGTAPVPTVSLGQTNNASVIVVVGKDLPSGKDPSAAA
jgi:rhodanese-related sulfurtransferase